MTPHAIYDVLIQILNHNSRFADFWNDNQWNRPEWTRYMTEALVKAIEQVAASVPIADFKRAAIGHPDSYGRSEYLDIDITGYQDDYSAPLVMIEHENSRYEGKLRYCLLKLLWTRAQIRILVCYIDSSGRYTGRFPSVQALLTALDPVRAAHPNEPVSLIVGEWNEDPITTWADVFTLHPL